MIEMKYHESDATLPNTCTFTQTSYNELSHGHMLRSFACTATGSSQLSRASTGAHLIQDVHQASEWPIYIY